MNKMELQEKKKTTEKSFGCCEGGDAEGYCDRAAC